MPPLSRAFIKTALVYFVAALLVGVAGALQAGRELLSPGVAALGPVHVHLLVVGWITQMIFGVAYWMFPKNSQTDPRGFEWVGWATYALLNVGLLLRVLAEPMHARLPRAGFGWLLVLAAVLQWLAAVAFVANTWRRVREK